jgi:thiamine-monophosphate kinase
MRLAHVGELSLVQWIRKEVPRKNKNLIIGIGDDAAAFRPPPGRVLLFTADTMAEGVHFRLDWTTPYQLGWKIVSINVSDIYAMGGVPLYAAFELTAPKKMEDKFIKRLFAGILDALGLYGAVLSGGNVSESRSGLVLSMSVIGACSKPVARKGARPGHGVYVTGPLGESACGLRLLKLIKKPIEIEKGKKTNKPLKWEVMAPLVRRHLMPLAKLPPKQASAMIDISDGLFLDLSRLCKESGVGVKIYEARIPISPELAKASHALGLDALALATGGGEDYQLLYTAPMGATAPQEAGGTFIGEVLKKGLYLLKKDGSMKEFKALGYTHFAHKGQT